MWVLVMQLCNMFALVLCRSSSLGMARCQVPGASIPGGRMWQVSGV